MRTCASRWLSAALTAASAVAVGASSIMSANPQTGSFDLCFSADCARSLSLSPYQLSINTDIDYTTNDVISADVIADFSTLDAADLDNDGFDDPLVSRRTNDATSPGAWASGTLYARACIMAQCNPRPSDEDEFQRLLTGGGREDAIGVKLDVEHVAVQGSAINSTYETYNVARGALRLNLSLAVSPLAVQPDVLPMFAISFLVTAFEYQVPVATTTNVNAPDGHMYLQRVMIGTDLFLDLPKYAKVNRVDTMIYTAIKGQVSGELEDLVLVTLMFGPVTNSVGYEAALSSMVLPTTTTTGAETPAPAPSVVIDSSGNAVPTNIVTKPRGEFGLCLDATCSTDGVLTMGFAGLQVRGSAPMQFARFADSPAFLFTPLWQPPTTLGLGREVVLSNFAATVPQSAYRSPRRYEPGSDPVFFATVELYLSDATLDYGGQLIDLPRGAVKFRVSINNWTFASASDTLELSMAVNLVGRDGTPSLAAANYSTNSDGDSTELFLPGNTAINFPSSARIQGPSSSVGVNISPRGRDGASLLVRLTFPAFQGSLTYDTVMRANATPPTEPPTTTPPEPVSPAPTSVAPTTTVPVVVLEKPKRKVDSWGVAGFLLGFLAFILVASMIQCYKKARFKVDFSKILP